MKKNIFQYDDYRKLLKDYYLTEKKKAPGRFSYRYFSQRAGFSTSNLLLLVMQGKRNLTFESVNKFKDAMGLGKREAEYFHHLVFYNQARDPKEKINHFRKILSFREYRNIRLLTKEHMEYFSKWYYPAIRELANVAGFKTEPKWVVEKLCYQIKPSEAKTALDLLQKLGLIIQNPSGSWQPVDKHLISDSNAHSVALTIFHREMLRLGAESLKDSPDKRDISSLTMSMSEQQFKKIRGKISQFQNEIREVLAENTSDANIDRVCQLNFQLFHLAEAGRKAGGL